MTADDNKETAPEAAQADPAAAGSAADAAPARPDLEAEIADLKDRLLRTVADQENARRRHEREQADTRRYAVADFARDLLAVHDNLNRALASVTAEQRETNRELASLLEGVDLTARELANVLERHGVRQVDALGRKLDPNLHQAVAQVESAEAEPGTVVQLFQPGFVIHDRLLRAAMVAVAKAPAGQPPQGGSRIDVQA